MVKINTIVDLPHPVFLFYIILVKSHFASVENNILSDIRSFHMNMLEGSFDNKTDDNSVDSTAPGSGDQYLISSFKPERLSWNSHEPNTRSEISSRRDSGERQSTDKTRARQNPTNFVYNQLFSDVSGDKYSSFENEENFESRSQDADIANHRQYDIRYSDPEPLPERGNPAPRIPPVTSASSAPSKQANSDRGRSHDHNGQFYEGENIERGDYGHHPPYSDSDRFVAERQSRYQDRARADYTRDEGAHHVSYQDHHPVSRLQSYPVTRRRDPGPGYYDSVFYEDSQPAYNDHVVTRQLGADRQVGPVR